MVVESPLRNAITFLTKFGFFDVVLPFLLVFTLIFAILEKTRILGTEDGKPKKNLNAMFSFVVALFVVATPKIVNAITESLPQVAFLLIIVVSFMMLAGSILKTGEFELKGGWQVFLTIILFIAILGIFLNTIKVEGGYSILQVVLNFFITQWSGAIVGSLIILALFIGTIFLIVKSPKAPKEGSSE